MRGLTIWLCFGSWGGFNFYAFGDPTLLRVCFGFVSFAIIKMDIENLIEKTTHNFKEEKLHQTTNAGCHLKGETDNRA